MTAAERPDVLALVLQAAADAGDTAIAAYLARYGLPRQVVRDNGRMVYADTGEPTRCANGCESRCVKCQEEITKIHLRHPLESDQGQLL